MPEDTIKVIMHGRYQFMTLEGIQQLRRDLYFEKNQKLYQNQSSNGETLPKLNIGIYSKFDQY